METIPKERLHRIGIQNDISVTIKPSSIIIPFAAYGFIAVGAAVIIYLFLQLNHHGIVTKVQYNGCDGCALGQLERGALSAGLGNAKAEIGGAEPRPGPQI